MSETTAQTPVSPALGAGLAIAAGLAFSFYGLLYRLLETAGPWHIIFYRTAGIIPLVVLAMYLVNGRDAWRLVLRDWRGSLVAAIPLAAAQIFINLAFAETTVGSVLFVTALAPFGTAIGAWFFLRERIGMPTGIGMCIAIAGIFLVAGSGIAQGRALGVGLAFAAMLAIVAYNLVLRANRAMDLLPSVAYSTIITAAVSGGVLIASGAPATLPMHDFAVIQVMGAGSLGAGLVLFTLATRYRPVGELSLFAQVEIVLTPLWVWLGVGEIPATTALAGGGLILAGLVVALWWGGREAR